MFGLTKLTIKIQDLISFNYMVLLLATLQYQETYKLHQKLHLAYFHLVLNAL